MASRVAFLLLLIPCCHAGTFVVRVKESAYRAEENSSVTLEWDFTAPAKKSAETPLFILCEKFTVPERPKVLYHLHENEEVPMSQDRQFAGRVRCDREHLTQGVLSLRVSQLRLEDSGLYACEVNTLDFGTMDQCEVTVTEASVPQAATTADPTETGQGSSGHDRLGLSIACPVLASVSAAVLLLLRRHRAGFRAAALEEKAPGPLSGNESRPKLHYGDTTIV